MDAQKIEKFIDAGYTKEEIDLLFKDPKVDPEKKDPEPDQDKKDPAPDQGKKDPEPDKNSHENFAEAIKTLTDSMSALQNTIKEMQKANIDGAKTDSGKKDSINEVMQSFIEKL